MIVFRKPSAATLAMVALSVAAGCAVTLLVQWGMVALPPCNREFDLLAPNRRCNTTLELGEWDYEPMRDQLSEVVDEFKKAGKVSEVSVYFRDLTNGPRFRIGEYAGFQPASLTKLPVLIAYLHEADLQPDILDKVLSYSGSLDVNENVDNAEETIRPNMPYTVRELLQKMIVYSDNYSYKLLVEDMNKQPPVLAYLTFRDLNVQRMMTAPNADTVSILPYGDLFAVLYNTSYLTRASSQFALELLARSTFKDGIMAGVPPDTVVANKFGRRVLEGADDQLHDCGIVYHPASTYILCVMTSGSDETVQKSLIADVSRIVYDAVSEQHAEND